MADRDRASPRTIIVRWLALSAIVTAGVFIIAFLKCRKEMTHERYVRLGMRCLLGVEAVSRAELRKTLDATAAAAKRSEKPRGVWPGICARAFHSASQSKGVSPWGLAKAGLVRDAIETGELDKIEAALVPFAKP